MTLGNQYAQHKAALNQYHEQNHVCSFIDLLLTNHPHPQPERCGTWTRWVPTHVESCGKSSCRGHGSWGISSLGWHSPPQCVRHSASKDSLRKRLPAIMATRMTCLFDESYDFSGVVNIVDNKEVNSNRIRSSTTMTTAIYLERIA